VTGLEVEMAVLRVLDGPRHVSGWTGGLLIAALSDKCYPHGHKTLWRRVDRAIQSLRRKGRIVLNDSGYWERAK
jgi:hypothetical protein